jgi:hypothetical protein
MKLLLGFMLAAVICGMFSRTFDWRGYVAAIAAAVLVIGAYQADSGLW